MHGCVCDYVCIGIGAHRDQRGWICWDWSYRKLWAAYRTPVQIFSKSRKCTSLIRGLKTSRTVHTQNQHTHTHPTHTYIHTLFLYLTFYNQTVFQEKVLRPWYQHFFLINYFMEETHTLITVIGLIWVAHDTACFLLRELTAQISATLFVLPFIVPIKRRHEVVPVIIIFAFWVQWTKYFSGRLVYPCGMWEISKEQRQASYDSWAICSLLLLYSQSLEQHLIDICFYMVTHGHNPSISEEEKGRVRDVETNQIWTVSSSHGNIGIPSLKANK